MAVAAGDIWNFSLEQRLFGQQVFNTWACETIAHDPAISELEYMVDWWGTVDDGFQQADALLSELADIQSNEVTYIQWHVQRVTPNPTAIFLFPVQGILSGVVASTCETPNISMSISRRGLLPGKRNRGRIAVAGIPASMIAAGRFDAGVLAEAAGLAAQMHGNKTDVTGGTISMGFWSPEHDGIVNGAPVLYAPKWTPCVTASVRDTVRVQRSRTIGVGS